MTDERREHERHRIWFPMRIAAGGGEGLAISYDASAKGLLIASGAVLEVGAAIEVTFGVPPTQSTGNERTVRGVVVRVGKNETDPHGMWPNRIAVEFEEPVPALESVLAAEVEQKPDGAKEPADDAPDEATERDHDPS